MGCYKLRSWCWFIFLFQITHGSICEFKTKTGWKNSNPTPPPKKKIKHPQIFTINNINLRHDNILLGKYLIELPYNKYMCFLAQE